MTEWTSHIYDSIDDKITKEEQELSNRNVIIFTTCSRKNFRRGERSIWGVPNEDVDKVVKKLKERDHNYIGVRIIQLYKEQWNKFQYYDSLSSEIYRKSNFKGR